MGYACVTEGVYYLLSGYLKNLNNSNYSKGPKVSFSIKISVTLNSNHGRILESHLYFLSKYTLHPNKARFFY